MSVRLKADTNAHQRRYYFPNVRMLRLLCIKVSAHKSIGAYKYRRIKVSAHKSILHKYSIKYKRFYFNEYSTTRAVEGWTMVESEIWTGAPVRTLRPVFRSEAISE